MSKILVDTHVFRKLTGEYSALLECIGHCGDEILIANDIEKELNGRMKSPSSLGLKGYIDTLSRTTPITTIKKGRYEARYKHYCNSHKPPIPTHHKDHKWVKMAISEHASHIISNDSHLNLPDFRTNGNICKCVSPENYMNENCPNQD